MSVNLRQAHIGYAGYSADFSAPGDRRRFCAYGEARGLTIERADLTRAYDLVIVTHNGDLPGWNERKRRRGSYFKYVFELGNSYLTEPGFARRHLKAAARYALGVDSSWSPDFLETLIRTCEV